MASFKGNGRDDSSKRRADEIRRQRLGKPNLEFLEQRRLLARPFVPTSTDPFDAQHGPLAYLGSVAVTAYKQYVQYEQSGSKQPFTSSLASRVAFKGSSIGLDVRGTGDFKAFQSQLKSVGMVVTAADAGLKQVEGWAPLSSLPAIAQLGSLVGGYAVMKSTTRFVGAGNNEADASLFADQARKTFKVDGTGQKIGVISDSVNLVGGGLAASVASGDLPNNVQIVAEGASGADEGRAMLENIHDIAPGAALAFATGGPTATQPNGELGFAANISALAAAGSTVIVDDLGLSTDLYYQDGVVQRAINAFVAGGGTYLSAASNAADSGYQSEFRPVSATVPGIGAGTFMNFDPTGATQATTLTISVYSPTFPVFQFDQPVVAGSDTSIQSQVNFYVLDSNNNVIASGTQNNVASQSPIQFLQDSSGNFVQLLPGTFKVAIQVVSGPNPGHVAFYEPGNGGFNVDHQYGFAGGTFYPTVFGHSAGASTISVGAVPWFNTPPAQATSRIHNEDFSGFGPYIQVFNADGSPKAAPLVLNKPDVSAPDGGNTSFFAGDPIDTTNPPFPGHPSFPGQPATTTGQTPTATNLSQNLPSFFGTSSSAPNLAAVVALMRQANPGITQNQIISALTTTATPLNGAAKGTFNPQGGFGLVNTPAALAAAATLKVVFISPGAGQVATTAPSFLQVQFNKAVDLTTYVNGSFQVFGPNGATVTVGKPVGVDGTRFATFVRFPITIKPAANTVANGVYITRILAGAFKTQAGESLRTGVTDKFTLSQLNGPRITATSFNSRIVTVTFDVPVDPATITPANVYLIRAGDPNSTSYTGPNSTIVSRLPGATLSYNAATRTATINLSGVDQTSLPTDRYALVVRTGVRDAVGNPLNGQFNGTFPSGVPNGNGSIFLQGLGLVTLTAPRVTSLALTPGTDSGIAGDNNTLNNAPAFTGQVSASFPGTVAGLLVYAQFNGITHAGVPRGKFSLGTGASGRGFVGSFDVQTTTDANGRFTIRYPAGVARLPEGQNQIRIVVVGQSDQPVLPGLSSSQDTAFRIDNTLPFVGTTDGRSPTTIAQGANVGSLTNLSISIVDPVNPLKLGDPFAVDPKLGIPALDPVKASNTQNYRLYRIVNGVRENFSTSILSATYVSTSNRLVSSDPFTGRIDFTFAAGLPNGTYQFVVLAALDSRSPMGLTDAAGNSLTSSSQQSSLGRASDFTLSFNLQPTPAYISSFGAYSPDGAASGSFTKSDVRGTYEIPVAGATPRASAPPTLFVLNFSNSLKAGVDYTNAIQLLRSADAAGQRPDGDFGDLGITNTFGYTRVSGVTVTLASSVKGSRPGQAGYNNQLVVRLPAGSSLPADYYRFYMPNAGPNAIFDVFGNQLDGEFKGYKDATGKYVNLLPNGQVRGSASSDLPDLTGDGISGGAFMTGFVVVPNGNILYARADALYNPQVPSLNPTGSASRPFPVLAAESVVTTANGGNLNSVVNSGANFNSVYDRSGDGQFEPSAFYAAQQRVQANGGPVVILAQASLPSRDPGTGALIQKPFVLQAPAGSDPIINDGSAAIPALTTLVFQAGSILKMQNASLLVQNQGSALQILGGSSPTQRVTVTSYKDSSIGGVSNGDPSTVGSAGDYGGILFRNFNQAFPTPDDDDDDTNNPHRSSLFPGQLPITTDSTINQRLKGQFTNPNDPASQLDAISGADDVMSFISFLTQKFAGGAVPQTVGFRYDGITLKNSRPTIVNSSITDTNGSDGTAQAGISVDMDSLRADDTAQGPLIRNDVFLRNGLNGIYIRAEVSGTAEPTNAINYTSNPSVIVDTSRKYVLDDPYPYLLTSRMVVGQRLVQESGGSQLSSTDRLSILPGMVLKFSRGSALDIISTDASLAIGDQTYIKEYDANNNVSPVQPVLLPNGRPNPLAGQKIAGFTANSSSLAKAILTSLNDDAATTAFFDPTTNASTTIVQPLPAVPGGSGALQPTPGNVPDAARWGGILVASGAIAVINSTILRYGGGEVNTADGTGTRHVLQMGDGFNGARISITNNTFTDNSDVPIELFPNSLLAQMPQRLLGSTTQDLSIPGDPQRPLVSGNPFIHGNVFTGNDLNGVGVIAGPAATGGVINAPNLDVNSVWTGTDFTYILRDTIILGGGVLGRPTINADGSVDIPRPIVTLTLQSTLPGTVLADGTTVAAPGVPLLVKLQNPDGTTFNPVGDAEPGAAIGNSYVGGAGFVVGVDNGVDPTADSLIDPGASSQIRILGIGGNQTTGQTRVPVILTSIHDDTVGTTVNNVAMFQAIPGDTAAPAAGDGGVIYFGGNSLTDFDPQDPRSGSLIDNADIRYITRIEQQGSGLLYGVDTDGDNAFSFDNDGGFSIKTGLSDPLGRNNLAKQLTISNSNLRSFSSAALWAHPGYAPLLVALNYTQDGIVRGGNPGQPTHTYFVNNTIADMPLGIQIISQSFNDDQYPSPAMAVFLNNTFYDIAGNAIRTVAPVATNLNFISHVAFLAMDNIFSKIGGSVVATVGQNYGSDLQYNLFNQVTGPVVIGTPAVPNHGAVNGDPAFRDPDNGNFNLLASSAAIDRARSELGPSTFGDMLYPASTIVITSAATINQIPKRNTIGASNPFGGFIYQNPRGPDIVTLPGEPATERGFPDQWIPVLQTAAPTATGTGKNQATIVYVPLQGERDQAGNLRVKDPKSPNVGFGSRPFFDLGAYEYIIQQPPVVTAVQAVAAGIATNLYVAGGIAGTNKAPASLQVRFNERIDPSTITGNSVILLASGGDGVFGNGNSSADRAINLSGRLTFNPANNTLTIDTSGIFTTPATLNDEYRLILKGTGSSVIRDLDGLALDGFTANQTLPLPSGSDNFPGSDFLVNFTISTSTPSVNSGTFKLATSSDTSGGLRITKQNRPTFVGKITDVFPPANPLLGQSVHIDISSKGDGRFDLIDAGVGTTQADGTFSITLTKPIPDTPNTVGTNGITGGPGATYAIARVRVINQAGNASNLPTDPLSSFEAKNAVTRFEVDTKLPVITAFSPLANTVATVNASGGVDVSVTFNESIKPSSIGRNSIRVFRTGGTGSFTGTLVPVAIDTSTFRADVSRNGTYRVLFSLAGPLPNDAYEIIIKGTGSTPITDLAGNPLSGAFTGTFPTGGGGNQGSDFVNVPFTVFQPTQAHNLYVRAGATGATPTGARNNPFPTIAAAMSAAVIGDNVLVLPGTYLENVTVKAGVRLLSAALTSTNSSYIPGVASETLLYGVPTAENGSSFINTVFVSGGLVGVPTEVSGFSIISPLLGDPSLGFINSTNVAIQVLNSNAVIDRNIIINGGVGVLLRNTGANRLASQVFDNLIAGNIVGVAISGNGGSSLSSPYLITNNTIADNTIGLDNTSNSANALQAYVTNNIFYANHDLTTQRTGTGLQSRTPNTLGVGFNLFFQNGPSNTSVADDAVGSFGAFNPANLRSTPDGLGNLAGDPAFVAARDPRPDGDTPPVFFLDANYDLTGRSLAINAANNAVAPATDFLYRSPVRIAGKGFLNTGPASIGAFYFRGTGGVSPGGGSGTGSGGLPIGIPGSGGGGSNPLPNPGVPTGGDSTGGVTAFGSANLISSVGGGLPIGTKRFNVTDTSLSDQGTSTASSLAGGIVSLAAPSYIDLNFSNNIDPASLTPDDLVLTGPGIDPASPAKATSLAWIDEHAVRFFLTGNFQNDGAVAVTIPGGAIASNNGTLLDAYTDSFKVASGGTTAVAAPVAFFQPIQPIAVAGPVAVTESHPGKKGKKQAAKAAHAVQVERAAKKEAERKAAVRAARQAAAAAKQARIERRANARKIS